MKKIIVITIFFCLSKAVIAQKKIIFHYRNIENLNGRISDVKLEQYFCNGKSLEMPVVNKSLKNDSSYADDEMNSKKIIVGDLERMPFILKSNDGTGLIYAENIWLKSMFLVFDTLNNFNWEISNEKKKINNEICTKAETDFRGRRYIAWFKKDNLTKVGPWKFGGLPGIIFQVSDNENIYSYTLENIEYVDQFPAELKVPNAYANDEKISHSIFISKWKANKRDLEKDNNVLTYTLTGSTNIKNIVAPIKELY
ncbi:GLPGLI family protein [Pedobacter sp. P26]|uniref:GLPGLI family protein n=1 Tax=Pedobacter sp. P26 TaxID=3423956 RepID=UPI003D67CB87